MDKNVMRDAAEKYPQMISQPFDMIVNKIGFDSTVFFLDVLGHGTMYIPSPRFVFWECIKKCLREDRENMDILDLCRKYGINRQTVKRTINDNSDQGVKNHDI